MKWIGLTGGIASGKSTVAELLQKNGYVVVDADVIAHDVVARGSVGLKKVIDTFGRIYLKEDGELDRKKLGQLVFDNSEKRLELERIIHPLVQEKVREIKAELEKKGTKIAFYDVPLLFEKNLQSQFDATVVVACSSHVQMERLIKRSGLSKSAAAARIGSQLPIMDKAMEADYVIWNDGTLKDLEFEVSEFLKKVAAVFS